MFLLILVKIRIEYNFIKKSAKMRKQEFLSIEEIADTLAVSRQTVAKYIHDKELNAVKVKKNYKIHYKDFEKFLNKFSTVSEVKPVYSIKSRYCSLDYEGKNEEFVILNDNRTYYAETIRKEHSNDHNFFLFGDNLFALKFLNENYFGKIDLIYIDPPFGTGQNFGNSDNQLAYEDIVIDHHYLEFLRKRLILMRELLSEQGSIYVHTDKKIGHYVKIIMDEVFGFKNFLNDITRIKCNPKNFARNAYGNFTDMILFYAKRKDQNIWNDIRENLTEDEEAKLFPKHDNKNGRYTTHPLHAPGITVNGDTGEIWKGLKPPKGRHWRYSRSVLTELDKNGLIEWSDSGNPRKIVFAKDHIGKKIQDLWEFKDRGLSYVKYPTQKNVELLKRIIKNSSNVSSIILDAFAGSGGTLIAAEELNRKWIGIDNSPMSFEIVQESFKEKKIKCNYVSVIEKN